MKLPAAFAIVSDSIFNEIIYNSEEKELSLLVSASTSKKSKYFPKNCLKRSLIKDPDPKPSKIPAVKVQLHHLKLKRVMKFSIYFITQLEYGIVVIPKGFVRRTISICSFSFKSMCNLLYILRIEGLEIDSRFKEFLACLQESSIQKHLFNFDLSILYNSDEEDYTEPHFTDLKKIQKGKKGLCF